MLIDTKYNVNDKVFVIEGVNITEKTITEVHTVTTNKHQGTTYVFQGTSFSTNELRTFRTKQEAAEAWLATQNLSIGIKDNK